MNISEQPTGRRKGQGAWEEGGRRTGFWLSPIWATFKLRHGGLSSGLLCRLSGKLCCTWKCFVPSAKDTTLPSSLLTRGMWNSQVVAVSGAPVTSGMKRNKASLPLLSQTWMTPIPSAHALKQRRCLLALHSGFHHYHLSGALQSGSCFSALISYIFTTIYLECTISL